MPAPFHRTVGGDVLERYVEHAAAGDGEVPPWLEGTGIGDYDRDGMAAKLFKQNYMSTDLRAWKD